MWLNCAHRFTRHAACFHITDRVEEFDQRVLTALRDFTDKEQLEREITNLVTYVKPSLAGCKLYAMDYNAYMQWFEFFIEHPSLPAVKEGEKAQSLPLFIRICVCGDEPHKCNLCHGHGFLPSDEVVM